MAKARKLGKIALAFVALFLAFAVVKYFANPYHSPVKDPRARVLGYLTFRMPSTSMTPTIKQGAVFVVNTATLADRDPQPGEIVAFLFPPNPQMTYIKRVVAVGGATIEVRHGVVIVDGKQLDEPYLAGTRSEPDPRDDMEPRKVEAHAFFVLGDNRGNSEDSRHWGAVPRELMVGIYDGIAIDN